MLTSVVMNEGDPSQEKVSLPNRIIEEKQCSQEKRYRSSEDKESILYIQRAQPCSL